MKYVGEKQTVGVVYKAGDVVWIRPCRYWETQEPTEAVVVEDTRVACDKTHQFCVSVRITNDTHDVLECPDHMFFSKSRAKSTAHLLAALKEIKGADTAHQITERILAKAHNTKDKSE
jgi:hypothetical protein